MNAWYVVAIVFITTSINLLIVSLLLGYEVRQKISEGSGDWVTDYENDDLCLDCDKPMWVEGYIGDNIQLCHKCYVVKHTK
jgi:hypothetical protein